MILEILILRYELKGKDRTRPEIFRLVLGPCAQYSPLLKNNGLCTLTSKIYQPQPFISCFAGYLLPRVEGGGGGVEGL